METWFQDRLAYPGDCDECGLYGLVMHTSEHGQLCPTHLDEAIEYDRRMWNEVQEVSDATGRDTKQQQK